MNPAPAGALRDAVAPEQRTRLLSASSSEALRAQARAQGLTLNKHPDAITGPRLGLSIAEAC